MSCLECQHCNCACTSQTKTEVILYPNLTFTSARDTYEIRSKIFKVNRNIKQQKQQNELQDLSLIKSDMKKSDTMDTLSKIMSVPSCQLSIQKNTFYGVNQSKGNDSVWEKNKQNNKYIINSNCAQSRLEIINQSERITLRQQKKRRLNDSCINKLKSNLADSNMLTSHAFLSPHSSNITQKNLTVILLERQNGQLRLQFERLKEKQKELLAEQQKLKDKNNRQLGHLKKKSMELELRSSTRKKQLEQLQTMLKIVKGKKQKIIKEDQLKTKGKFQ